LAIEWSPQEYQLLLDCIAKSGNLREAAQLLAAEGYNRSPESIRGVLRRRALNYSQLKKWSSEETTTPCAPQFEPKTSGIETWEDFLDTASEVQVDRKLDEYGTLIASVHIPAEAAAVVWLADLQVGSQHTDYDALRKHLDFILKTPDIYVGLTGDELDNYARFPNPEPIVNQVLPPRDQYRFLRSLIKHLSDEKKLIATCWGNHLDERSEKVLGTSLREFLTESQEAPHFRGQGVLRLTVGEVEYLGLITHRPRYSSALNPIHGAIRLRDMIFPYADFVVTAHKHVPATMQLPKSKMALMTGETDGSMCTLVQCGTFQVDDTWSARGFDVSHAIMPTTVFSGREKRVFALCDHPQYAINLLQSIKER